MVTTNTEEKYAVQHRVISLDSYFNDSLWNKILFTVENPQTLGRLQYHLYIRASESYFRRDRYVCRCKIRLNIE